MNNRIFTISNILSMLRIVFAVPILYFLNQGIEDPTANIYALITILIAGFTDLFDGYLARRLDQVTELGKIIDPLADKIVSAIILVYLALIRPDFPLWLLIVAIVRDVVIFTAAMYVKQKYNYLFTSNMLGKWAFTVLGLTFAIFVVRNNFSIEWLFQSFLWLTFIMLILSFYVYAQRLWVFMQNQRKNA